MASSGRFSAILSFPLVVFNHFGLFLKTMLRFTNERKWQDYLATKYKLPDGLPVVNILHVTPGLNEKVSSFSFLDGTSRVIDIAFIKALVKQFPDCAYLEIGSWRGESLLNISEYTKDAVSVSLSEKEMQEMNFPKEMIELDGIFIKNLTNIKRIGANSFHFDFGSLNKKFDVIFVDGDHSYDGVKNDTAKVFPLLKNENSIIVWHDCGNSYEDMRPEVISGILDGLPASEQKHVYRVSNTLCGIYSKKKLLTYFRKGTFNMPDKTFTVQITTENKS